MVAGAFSVGAVVNFGKKIIEMAGEADKAYAKVEQAVKQTGGVAGFTAEALAKIAKQLQNITTYDDDEILNKVTAQLLSFPTIVGDNFLRAQKAAMDLATLLGGDLQSSAIQVGKALGDPVKGLMALRKSGVLFTESEQELIKSLARSNRLFEAQSIILDAIDAQYGGQAEALAQIPIGKIEQMKNAWGDLGETLGNAVAPAVVSVSEGLKGLALNIQRPYSERSWFGRFLADLDPVYNFQVLKNWISGTGKLQTAVNAIDASTPVKSLADLNKELAELEMNQYAAKNATTEEQKALFGTAESYDSQIAIVRKLIEEKGKEAGANKEVVETLNSLEEQLKTLQEQQESSPLSDFETYQVEIDALEKKIKKYKEYGKTVKEEIINEVGSLGYLNAKISENTKLIEASGSEIFKNRLRAENTELQKQKEWLEKLGETDYKSPMTKIGGKSFSGQIVDIDPETTHNAEVFGWKLDAIAEAEKKVSASAVDWKGVSGEFEQFINKEDMAIELTNTLAASIAGLGDSLAQGADSWAEYGEMVIDSLKSAIAMIIKEGVAIAVKNALIEYGATGPVALALAALTGGLAAGIFSTAINQIPSFAEGGFIKSPQLIMAGDAKDGKGEWILNSQQMKNLTAQKQAPFVIKGELKARGRELVYVFNNESAFHGRT
jgi:hypothetical protein